MLTWLLVNMDAYTLADYRPCRTWPPIFKKPGEGSDPLSSTDPCPKGLGSSHLTPEAWTLLTAVPLWQIRECYRSNHVSIS